MRESAYFAAFARDQRIAGLSENTIQQRRWQLGHVEAELGHLLDLDAGTLLEWYGDQAWAANTRRAYRGSLRAFYAFAQREGLRADDPAAKLPRVKVPRAIPRPTPEFVLNEALRRCANPHAYLALRLAAGVGLRRGELAAIHSDDLVEDLTGTSLIVHGKGGKERIVPLTPELADLLRSRPVGWAFPSPSPRCAGRPMTPGYLGKLVAEALPGVWTCHTLRHRCASLAYQESKDLRTVQELLGHASPVTTQIYTQVPDEALRRLVEVTAD